jgi:G:T-mismatch repair DNA endonuclease (very short patch repair protein)
MKQKNRKYPLEERVCVCGCNRTFIVNIKSKKKYFETDCNVFGNKMYRKIHCLECVVCKKAFVSRGSSKKTCSKECYKELRKILRKKQNQNSHKQTYPEKIIEAFIINNNLPFAYTGSGFGSKWVGDKNPDFLATDNSKRIIEFLGCHWHGCPKCNLNDKLYQHSIYRIVGLQNLGYDILLIWGHDFKKKIWQQIILNWCNKTNIHSYGSNVIWAG